MSRSSQGDFKVGASARSSSTASAAGAASASGYEGFEFDDYDAPKMTDKERQEVEKQQRRIEEYLKAFSKEKQRYFETFEESYFDDVESSTSSRVFSDEDIAKYFEISGASDNFYQHFLKGDSQEEADLLHAVIFSLQQADFFRDDSSKAIVFEGDSKKTQHWQIIDFLNFVKAFKRPQLQEKTQSLTKFRQETQDADFSDFFAEIQDPEVRGIEDYKKLSFQEREAFLARIGEEKSGELFKKLDSARQTASSIFDNFEKLDFLEEKEDEKKNQVFLFKGVDANGDAFFIVFSNFANNVKNSLSFFGKDNSPAKVDFEKLLYGTIGDNKFERFFAQKRDDFMMIDSSKKKGVLEALMSKFNRGFAFQGFEERFLIKANSQNQEIVDVVNSIIATVLGSKKSLVEKEGDVESKFLFLKDRISFLFGKEIEGENLEEFLKNVQNYFDGLDLQKRYLRKALKEGKIDISRISDENSLKESVVNYFLRTSSSAGKIKLYIQENGGIEHFKSLSFEEKAEFLEGFIGDYLEKNPQMQGHKTLGKYQRLISIVKGEVVDQKRYQEMLDDLKQRVSYVANSYQKTNISALDNCSDSHKNYLVLRALYQMIKSISDTEFQEKIVDTFKQGYDSGESVFLEQRNFSESDFSDYYEFLQSNSELLSNFAGIERALGKEFRGFFALNEHMVKAALENGEGVEVEKFYYVDETGKRAEIQSKYLSKHFLDMIARKANIAKSEDFLMQHVLVKNLIKYLQEFEVGELQNFDAENPDVRDAAIKKSLLLFIYQYFKDSERAKEEKADLFERSFLPDDSESKGDFRDFMPLAELDYDEEMLGAQFSLHIPVATSLEASKDASDKFVKYFKKRLGLTKEERDEETSPLNFFKEVKGYVSDLIELSITDSLSDSEKKDVESTAYFIVYNAFIKSRNFVKEEHQKEARINQMKDEFEAINQRDRQAVSEIKRVYEEKVLKILQEEIDRYLKENIKADSKLDSYEVKEEIVSKTFQDILKSPFFIGEFQDKPGYKEDSFKKVSDMISDRFKKFVEVKQRRMSEATASSAKGASVAGSVSSSLRRTRRRLPAFPGTSVGQSSAAGSASAAYGDGDEIDVDAVSNQSRDLATRRRKLPRPPISVGQSSAFGSTSAAYGMSDLDDDVFSDAPVEIDVDDVFSDRQMTQQWAQASRRELPAISVEQEKPESASVFDDDDIDVDALFLLQPPQVQRRALPTVPSRSASTSTSATAQQPVQAPRATASLTSAPAARRDPLKPRVSESEFF